MIYSGKVQKLMNLGLLSVVNQHHYWYWLGLRAHLPSRGTCIIVFLDSAGNESKNGYISWNIDQTFLQVSLFIPIDKEDKLGVSTEILIIEHSSAMLVVALKMDSIHHRLYSPSET